MRNFTLISAALTLGLATGYFLGRRHIAPPPAAHLAVEQSSLSEEAKKALLETEE
jgi:hypothetical protein